MSKVLNLSHLFLLFLVVIGGLGWPSPAHAQVVSVDSPQKRVQVALDSSQGKLSYRVTIKGQTAIEPSALGISVEGQNLGENTTLGQPTARDFRETYPVTGVHATALNAYREAIFPVQSGPAKTPWQMEVRVFNDGVAMRYRVPLAGQHTIMRGRICRARRFTTAPICPRRRFKRCHDFRSLLIHNST